MAGWFRLLLSLTCNDDDSLKQPLYFLPTSGGADDDDYDLFGIELRLSIKESLHRTCLVQEEDVKILFYGQ